MRTCSLTARSRFIRKLTVRDPGSEDEIDRQLLCYAVRTGLIFFDPPFLRHRLKRRRNLSLKRPQIEGELVNGNLPIKPPILHERSNDLIDCPDPPFSDDRPGRRPSHLIDFESDKPVMRLAADEAGVLRNLLKDK